MAFTIDIPDGTVLFSPLQELLQDFANFVLSEHRLTVIPNPDDKQHAEMMENFLVELDTELHGYVFEENGKFVKQFFRDPNTYLFASPAARPLHSSQRTEVANAFTRIVRQYFEAKPESAAFLDDSSTEVMPPRPKKIPASDDSAAGQEMKDFSTERRQYNSNSNSINGGGDRQHLYPDDIHGDTNDSTSLLRAGSSSQQQSYGAAVAHNSSADAYIPTDLISYDDFLGDLQYNNGEGEPERVHDEFPLQTYRHFLRRSDVPTDMKQCLIKDDTNKRIAAYLRTLYPPPGPSATFAAVQPGWQIRRLLQSYSRQQPYNNSKVNVNANRPLEYPVTSKKARDEDSQGGSSTATSSPPPTLSTTTSTFSDRRICNECPFQTMEDYRAGHPNVPNPVGFTQNLDFYRGAIKATPYDSFIDDFHDPVAVKRHRAYIVQLLMKKQQLYQQTDGAVSMLISEGDLEEGWEDAEITVPTRANNSKADGENPSAAAKAQLPSEAVSAKAPAAASASSSSTWNNRGSSFSTSSGPKLWFGDYEALEAEHGFIQWLFPLQEGAGLSSYTHRLLKREIDLMKQDPTVMLRIRRSYDTMLDFYGLRVVNRKTGELAEHDNANARLANLNECSHNYLRITRILKFLGDMGMEHYKPKFIQWFTDEIYHRGDTPVDDQASCSETAQTTTTMGSERTTSSTLLMGGSSPQGSEAVNVGMEPRTSSVDMPPPLHGRERTGNIPADIAKPQPRKGNVTHSSAGESGEEESEPQQPSQSKHSTEHICRVPAVIDSLKRYWVETIRDDDTRAKLKLEMETRQRRKAVACWRDREQFSHHYSNYSHNTEFNYLRGHGVDDSPSTEGEASTITPLSQQQQAPPAASLNRPQFPGYDEEEGLGGGRAAGVGQDKLAALHQKNINDTLSSSSSPDSGNADRMYGHFGQMPPSRRKNDDDEDKHYPDA